MGWVIVVAVCVVALASLPYIVVHFTTPPDLRFVGTLLNPLDGDSYLAKMQIGAQGDWLFHLPYTAQDHPGALILTHYLALGHVAAWTHLPIPLVYHLARVVAGFALLLTVYAFIARVTQDLTERRLAFLFVALSSGLGLAGRDVRSPGHIRFGHPRIEHVLRPAHQPAFSIGDGVDGRHDVGSEVGRPKGGKSEGAIALTVSSLALAIVQPFAVVTVYVALGVYLVLRWRRDGRIAWPVVWTSIHCGHGHATAIGLHLLGHAGRSGVARVDGAESHAVAAGVGLRAGLWVDSGAGRARCGRCRTAT